MYKRIFVADGNFKADHVRQKNEDGDVWLSEGSGMIPKREEYLTFLASAIERLTVSNTIPLWLMVYRCQIRSDRYRCRATQAPHKKLKDSYFFFQKAPCENTFRAITNALQASKLCDITGVFSIACGRHGCYAPQALVDMFKGEQQKNGDFAFIKSLIFTHVEPEQGVLLIYDIVCQYIIYLLERIGKHLPPGLIIDAAIGLFHVHAHKDQCFFQYATTFIPGAGIVAGEILESLWSTLNSISPTARTATLAHRAEMLDDHTTDSNHKKMIGMVSGLRRSYRRSIDMLDHARTYYQNLTYEAGRTAIEKWTNDIERVESTRKEEIEGATVNRGVVSMDIYAAKLPGDTPVDQHTPPAIPSSPLGSWMELSLVVEEKQ